MQYMFWSLQVFPGDITKSLGEDSTFYLLLILGEHYGMVMMFDTLSKEDYSLKQRSGENAAEFRMCLLQKV